MIIPRGVAATRRLFAIPRRRRDPPSFRDPAASTVSAVNSTQVLAPRRRHRGARACRRRREADGRARARGRDRASRRGPARYPTQQTPLPDVRNATLGGTQYRATRSAGFAKRARQTSAKHGGYPAQVTSAQLRAAYGASLPRGVDEPHAAAEAAWAVARTALVPLNLQDFDDVDVVAETTVCSLRFDAAFPGDDATYPISLDAAGPIDALLVLVRYPGRDPHPLCLARFCAPRGRRFEFVLRRDGRCRVDCAVDGADRKRPRRDPEVA